jgi:RimJ/RimL family protein N-acetyltransferase
MNEQYRYKTKDDKEVLIRSMREEDIDIMIDIMDSIALEKIFIANEGVKDKDFFKLFVLRRIEKGIWVLLVAQLEGKIVGHANVQIGHLQKNKHTAYVATMIANPYRSIGIGSALMAESEKNAKLKGVEKLYLSVFSINKTAKKAYERWGFKTEAVLTKQFKIEGQYVDEIYMSKWI